MLRPACSRRKAASTALSLCRRLRRRAWVAAAATAAIHSAASGGSAATVSWTGLAGDGLWSSPNNWSSAPALPAATDDVVNTLAAATITHTAGTDTINSFLSAGTLSLNAGVIAANGVGISTLQVNNTLRMNGGTLRGFVIQPSTGGHSVTFNANGNNFFDAITANAPLDLDTITGTLRSVNGLTLNSTLSMGSSSVLGFQDTQSLSGSGTIVFDNSSSTVISLDSTTAATWTIGSGIRIRGQNARIGPAQFNANASKIINNGVISSDTGGAFILTPGSTAADAILNNNLIEARNAGSIRIDRNVTNAGAGRLDVTGTFSAINQASVRITGGTINVSNGANFVPNNTANNFLDAVTVNGTLNISAGGQERIANGLTLNGTLLLNSHGVLAFQETQTLGGIGSVVVGASSNNRISIDGVAPATLTIGSGITLRGQTVTFGPAVYQSTTSKLVNNGTISADVAAGTFTLNPSSSALDSIRNNNLIEARNGGTVRLSSNLANAGSGHIDVAAASTLLQNGVRITGGAINVAAGGNYVPSNSANNFLDAVAVNGSIDMSGLSQLRILNGLALNGAATINSSSVLGFSETQTLSGPADILFGGTGTNRLSIDGAAAATLTIAANVRLHGQNASIGPAVFQSTNSRIVNNGTISADVAAGNFSLNPSSTALDSIRNNNLIEARNGGAVTLNGNLTNSGGGHIGVLGGSTFTQNGVRITGGTINVAAGGHYVPINSGNNILDAVTVNGDIDMTAAAQLRSTNGLVLNGTATINNSIIGLLETQSLLGTATLVFGAAPSSRLSIDGTAPATLTIGPNVLLRGQNATIGQSAYQSTSSRIVNNGTISADVAGGIFQLNTSSSAANSITNSNLVEARNGAGLTFNAHFTNSGAGHVDILAGSVLSQSGVRITGGTINIAAGANYIPTNSGDNFVDGVTVNGNINMSGLARLRSANGLTLNGTLNIDANSILGFQETQTLGGVGTLAFGTMASNRISIDGAAPATLTIGPNITLRGHSAVIGPANYQSTTSKIVNTGTISADVSGGVFVLNPSSSAGDSIANSGRIEARNGATLRLLSNTLVNPSGAILVADANSTISAESAQITGGQPLTNHGSLLFVSSAGGSVGPIAGDGSTSLTNAGTLNATHLRQTALSIAAGTLAINANGGVSGTSIVKSLSIATAANNGALDLRDNDLVVDYTGATQVDSVRALIANAYNAGAWNRGGITSSEARASTSPKTSLGYRESSAMLGAAGGIFSGQTVDGTAVLVKYTYGGDANLDGKVDVGDLGALASNWQLAAMWEGGDFDYNGTVNVGDLGILATNWQAGVTTPPLGPSFSEAMAAMGLPNTSIPEPAATALATALYPLLARRLSRRGSRW